MTAPPPPSSDPQASESPGADLGRRIDVAFLIHELKGPLAVVEAGVRALMERREKLGPLTDRQERTLKRVLLIHAGN